LRIADAIGEDRGSAGARGRAIEQWSEPPAVKKIVAQNQGRRIAAEKIAGDNDCPRDSIRVRLLCVAEPDAPLAAVRQQLLKLRQIAGRRDDENVSDAREHEHRQRIIDHRLVVDGKQLLRDGRGYGMEAGRPAAREKNATHLCPFVLTSPGREACRNAPRCSLDAKPIDRAVVSQFDALPITIAGAELAFWGLWALLVSSRLAVSSIALLGAFSNDGSAPLSTLRSNRAYGGDGHRLAQGMGV
jgi:hypothetical protein